MKKFISTAPRVLCEENKIGVANTSMLLVTIEENSTLQRIEVVRIEDVFGQKRPVIWVDNGSMQFALNGNQLLFETFDEADSFMTEVILGEDYSKLESFKNELVTKQFKAFHFTSYQLNRRINKGDQEYLFEDKFTLVLEFNKYSAEPEISIDFEVKEYPEDIAAITINSEELEDDKLVNIEEIKQFKLKATGVRTERDLTEGKIYSTIYGIEPGVFEYCPFVTVIDDCGRRLSCHADRFDILEKIEE